MGYLGVSAKTRTLKPLHSKAHRKLCILLRQVREERGMTQSALAEKLEVPQSFVSKVESGERRLDILELRQVCLALDVPLRKVVQRLEEVLS